MTSMDLLLERLQITGIMKPGFDGILTLEALDFLSELQERFNDERSHLLDLRKERHNLISRGLSFEFPLETKDIRNGDWKVSPVPKDLQDRRVEITGPVERKMVINALNSGAKVFMADFEDSSSPTWTNMIEGQINLKDAVRREIIYTNESKQKTYSLNQNVATLMVRPRGLHLTEKHVCDSQGFEFSAALFDFGLFFFHNANRLIENGSGPYFYLPKLESYLEARWWNEVFKFSQTYLGIPQGTIKATVLIETLPASFEMDEILFELKEHSAGLNCGRWDYIFSYIKKLGMKPGFVMPHRSQITMKSHFMESYCKKVVQVCHKRGIHAMGGMAAQIPIKNDEQKNSEAYERVKEDKLREVKLGHDGTWVAHPGLIPLALEVFNAYMKGENQINHPGSEDNITPGDLVKVPSGTITEDGIVSNIDIAVRYVESWLSGKGCVPLYNLMEDAATAEISRIQLWQWVHNEEAKLEDGRKISWQLYNSMVPKAVNAIKKEVGELEFEEGNYTVALGLLNKWVKSPELCEFLTESAYHLL